MFGTGQSHPWTKTSLGGKRSTNFKGHWSIWISLKTRQRGHWSIWISLKFIWTNGSQISLKVLVYAGIGPQRSSLNPPQKTPTQTKRVCTNSLHKQFAQTLLPLFWLKGKRGQLVQTVSKLFEQTVLEFGWVFFFGVGLFYLQLEPFCSQLSAFAYSPLRPLIDALSHCKQKSSNCK